MRGFIASIVFFVGGFPALAAARRLPALPLGMRAVARCLHIVATTDDAELDKRLPCTSDKLCVVRERDITIKSKNAEEKLIFLAVE